MWTSGFDYLQINNDDSGTVPIEHDNLDDPSGASYDFSIRSRPKRLAVYQSVQLNLPMGISYTVGVRHERDSNNSHRFTDVRNALRIGAEDGWNVMLSAGQYHLYPDIDYLHRNYGNPHLEPMAARHYIARLNK